MNLQSETRFSEERLVAFLLGLLDAEAEAELRGAAQADAELAMQLLILASMLPSREDGAELKAHSETAGKSGQAETLPGADTLDVAADDAAALPPELRRAARLQAEGASVAEIARATDTTQALVRIQLQQIEVLRRRSP